MEGEGLCSEKLWFYICVFGGRDRNLHFASRCLFFDIWSPDSVFWIIFILCTRVFTYLYYNIFFLLFLYFIKYGYLLNANGEMADKHVSACAISCAFTIINPEYILVNLRKEFILFRTRIFTTLTYVIYWVLNVENVRSTVSNNLLS